MKIAKKSNFFENFFWRYEKHDYLCSVLLNQYTKTLNHITVLYN